MLWYEFHRWTPPTGLPYGDSGLCLIYAQRSPRWAPEEIACRTHSLPLQNAVYCPVNYTPETSGTRSYPVFSGGSAAGTVSHTGVESAPSWSVPPGLFRVVRCHGSKMGPVVHTASRNPWPFRSSAADDLSVPEHLNRWSLHPAVHLFSILPSRSPPVILFPN